MIVSFGSILLSSAQLALRPSIATEPLFFFFQAEDGIRDYKVTGVQTCALPISEAIPSEVRREELAKRTDLRERNIVTIDGETAKDFDDAVEVSILPNGNFLLGVQDRKSVV